MRTREQNRADTGRPGRRGACRAPGSAPGCAPVAGHNAGDPGDSVGRIGPANGRPRGECPALCPKGGETVTEVPLGEVRRAVYRPVRQGNALEDTVARLVQTIRLGVVAPGESLPAERELAGLYAVSRDTVREAIRELADAGYLVRRRGRYGGTFVADPLPRPADPGTVPARGARGRARAPARARGRRGAGRGRADADRGRTRRPLAEDRRPAAARARPTTAGWTRCCTSPSPRPPASRRSSRSSPRTAPA